MRSLTELKLVIENDNPSIVRINDFSDPFNEIKESLTFKDKAAHYAYTKFKNNPFWKFKMDPEKYTERLEKLKSEVKKSLLFEDERGFYTYSGLTQYIQSKTRCSVDNQIVYPEPNSLPWINKPPHTPYPYQVKSEEELLLAKHGGVELGTGLGKSLIAINIIRKLGLKTIIACPLTNLSEQMYDQLVSALGKKYVGAFYDGKKESKKLIVVATAQSLTKVTPGTPHWEELSQSKVFLVDESHSFAADTLANVCLGVGKTAPYRFFFSATQIRGDGRTLMLDGITGPIVYKKTVKEGIEGKYLAKPSFKIIKMNSDLSFQHSDASEMNRKHLLHNPKVTKKIGELVNLAADAGLPVVVLTEEVEQFTSLLPYLRHKVGFAHGTLTKDNRHKVPEEYQKSDVKGLVKEFNEGRLQVLVGTSCVSTGTDIRPVKFLIYWQGGSSETQVKQGIGRGTRISPGKTAFTVVDFEIENIQLCQRHAKARQDIFQELWDDVKFI